MLEPRRHEAVRSMFGKELRDGSLICGRNLTLANSRGRERRNKAEGQEKGSDGLHAAKNTTENDHAGKAEWIQRRLFTIDSCHRTRIESLR